MSEFMLRRLTGRDWGVLRSVRLRALSESPGSFATSAEEAAGWPDSVWTAWAEHSAVFVAWAGNEPAGMVSEAPRDGSDECGLAAMWVDPTYRGSGLADELVTSFLGHARDRGAARVTLWVEPVNLRAAGLYRRHGFTPTGESKETTLGTVTELSLDHG
jgi:ribosomal protein S18 acetylase RimI-like enzyme